MKVVIDTNVLISAVLRDKDPEVIIQFIIDNDQFEWVVSQEILVEYKEVLGRRKFRLEPSIKERWFGLLETFPTRVEATLPIDFPRDPKDAKFLACAIAANADFLVTGDTDLVQAQDLVEAAIVTVATFKNLFYDVQ